jgi:hypothetical protein
METLFLGTLPSEGLPGNVSSAANQFSTGRFQMIAITVFMLPIR